MNARKVQIDFSVAAPGAPVTLRAVSSASVRPADILASNTGRSATGAIEKRTASLNLLVAAEKSMTRHAQTIRWGINE